MGLHHKHQSIQINDRGTSKNNLKPPLSEVAMKQLMNSDKKITKSKAGKSQQANGSMKRMRDGSRNSVNLNITHVTPNLQNFSPLANPAHYKNVGCMSP